MVLKLLNYMSGLGGIVAKMRPNMLSRHDLPQLKILNLQVGRRKSQPRGDIFSMRDRVLAAMGMPLRSPKRNWVESIPS